MGNEFFERARPVGFEQGEIFTAQGGNESVLKDTQNTQLISLEIPSGQKYFCSDISLRVVDIGGISDIFYTLRHNGIPIPQFRRIAGTQVDTQPLITINMVLSSGLLEIVADNDSATLDITCQASIFGFQVRNALIQAARNRRFF